VIWFETKVLALEDSHAVCLSKFIAVDRSEIELLRLSLVSDQTLV